MERNLTITKNKQSMKIAEEILNKHVTDGTGIEVTTEEAIAAMEEYANQFKQPPTDEELDSVIEGLDKFIHDVTFLLLNTGISKEPLYAAKRYIRARKMSNQQGIMQEFIEWMNRLDSPPLEVFTFERILTKATELLNQSK